SKQPSIALNGKSIHFSLPVSGSISIQRLLALLVGPLSASPRYSRPVTGLTTRRWMLCRGGAGFTTSLIVSSPNAYVTSHFPFTPFCKRRPEHQTFGLASLAV